MTCADCCKYCGQKWDKSSEGFFSLYPHWILGWNYEKFLVDAEGRVLGRYTHQVDVLTLKDKIKELLAK